MKNLTENLEFEDDVLKKIDRLESKIDKILEVIKGPKSDTDLLTVHEVEDEYKISEWKLREARRDPYYPLEHLIIGRNIKFRRSHIEAYLNKREVKSDF